MGIHLTGSFKYIAKIVFYFMLFGAPTVLNEIFEDFFYNKRLFFVVVFVNGPISSIEYARIAKNEFIWLL